MEKYYLLPRKVTNNNKLREFQFKILHRYLATNIVLYKMKMTNINTCTLCNIVWCTRGLIHRCVFLGLSLSTTSLPFVCGRGHVSGGSRQSSVV